MPTGKRASMREGPLAALFRKTVEDTGISSEQGAPREAEPEEEQTRQHIERESEQAASERERRLAEHRRDEPRPAGPESEHAEPRRERPTREREPEAEPVAPDQVTKDEEHHVRSPQERLRHAFSTDIPESLLDRPESKSAPQRDVYARAQPELSIRPQDGRPVLRVVGVGGAGVNAINRMVEAEIEGIEFLAINTDLQSLQQCAAHETLHIGDSITRGLGSGSNPDLGRQAAHEEYDRIKALLRGSDMVFIAAGAGGGTGTGAAPVVAQISRELGALTVGIVTRPFQFEGSRRREQAEAGIAALADEVDTLIVVPNNRLLSVLDRNISIVEAFRVADDVLRQGVQGISDLVTLPGLINLDFADVRTIMSGAGNALLGIGMGTGERRAIDAAEQAVSSPLLETSMDGSRSILLSITGGRDLSLWEVNESAKAVAEAAHPDANIIFGAMVDEKLDDQVWVTVIATGFGEQSTRQGERELLRTGERNIGERDRAYRQPLREPGGEPHVTRRRRVLHDSPSEIDIPEFIPRA